jgi:hypothetical protein
MLKMEAIAFSSYTASHPKRPDVWLETMCLKSLGAMCYRLIVNSILSESVSTNSNRALSADLSADCT